MRVPTADYSPLLSAIKGQETVNSLRRQKRAIEQDAANSRADSVYNWVSLGTNTALQIGQFVAQSKSQAEAEQSKADLLNFETDLNAKLKDSVFTSRLTDVGSDGNIVYGDDVQGFVNDYIASVDGKKWSKATKAAHISNIKALFGSADSKAYSFLNLKNQSEWADAYSNNLRMCLNSDAGKFSFEQLQMGNLSDSDLYGMGFSEIDAQVKNGKLSAEAADIEKAKYKRGVDNSRAQAVLSSVAKLGGDREAVQNWLKSSYGLSDADVLKLANSADAVEKDYLSNVLVANGKQVMSDVVNSYGSADFVVSPAQAKENMRASLKAQGQSDEHIEAVIDAMSKVQYRWAQDRVLKYDDDIASGSALVCDADLTELESDKKAGMFEGACEDVYAKTFEKLEGVLSADAKAKSDAKAAEAKALSETRATFAKNLQADIEEILSDESMTVQRRKAVADAYINNKADVIEKYYGKAEAEKYRDSIFKKMVKSNVNKVYEPYADKAVEVICYNYAQSMGYETLNGKIIYTDDKNGLALEKEQNVVGLKTEAELKMLKLLEEAAQSNMPFETFKDRVDTITTEFVSAMSVKLEESSAFNNSDVTGVLEVLEDTGVRFDSDSETLKLPNSISENNYKIAVDNCAGMLREEYGIDVKAEDLGANVDMYKVVSTDSKGEKHSVVHPVPVFTDKKTDKKYLCTSAGVFELNAENEGVDLVEHPELENPIKTLKEVKKEEKKAKSDASYAKMYADFYSKKYDKSKEEKLIDNYRKNKFEKSRTHYKNELVNFYVNNGMSRKEAEAKVAAL